jgi:hypothetical protein
MIPSMKLTVVARSQDRKGAGAARDRPRIPLKYPDSAQLLDGSRRTLRPGFTVVPRLGLAV